MFDESNITHKNSDNSSGFGLCCWQGHQAQQNDAVYRTMYNLISSTQPARIVEIGTAAGGLTMFLKWCVDDLNLSTPVITYDKVTPLGSQALSEAGVDTRVRSWHYDEPPWLPTPEFIELLQEPGRVILLCDGGNKIHEFNTLAPLIKSDDIIMAHDYARDRDFFDNNIKGVVWDWLEITDNDISDISRSENLEPYMQDEFDNCVWVCKKKHS